MRLHFLTVHTLLLLPQGADAVLLDFLFDLLCFLTFGLFFCRPDEVDETFDIQLQLLVPEDTKIYYERGAARLSEIVTTGVPDVGTGIIESFFKPDNRCQYPAKIDDLFICAFDGFIDGRGDSTVNVLGFAAPYYASVFYPKRTIVGYAKFETVDASDFIGFGLFQSIVDHEFLHILGIGTLWDCPSVGSNSPKANAEFQALSGCDFNAPTGSNGDGTGRCNQ